jgi:UDP-N-acetylmuramyl pentapeptide phosphotransferase/UDP-N-acetylglucosamine-1-phosphate transferase
MQYILLCLVAISFYFLNNFFIKKKILPNFSGETHQLFVGEKNIPLSGGLFLIFIFVIFFLKIELFIIVHLLFIFLLGISSDIRSKISPILRLFFQALIVVSFVITNDLSINYTRVLILDNILQNSYYNIFFVSFCILILINGTNFIDGLNGLVITYYLGILITIFYLGHSNSLVINEGYIEILIFSLIFLLVLNLFNRLFLGDSGSYILGLFFGYHLISLYSLNSDLSPFFIVLLLWYPCFEILFSMIRKFQLNKSPIFPDKNHFHQLLYYFLLKRLSFKKNIINNCTSFLINFYNIIIFALCTINIYDSSYIIFLTIVNIFIYIFFYIRLFKYKYKLFNK